MSELIVIGYQDETTADRVLDELQSAEREWLVDLDDAAVIVRNKKGKLKVHTTDHLVAGATLGGMFWGMLIGLLFLVPIAGLAIGAIVGAAAGGLTRLGVKDDFKQQVADMVKPGTSAILAVIRKMTPDKVIEEISPYGGTVLRTSLSYEEEEELISALHHGEEKPAA
jgi:uncharacterized membrane protein